MTNRTISLYYFSVDIITERGTLQSRYETYLSESVGLTNGKKNKNISSLTITVFNLA